MAILRKRGKVWYIDYRLAGKRYRKVVGRSKELAIITLHDIQGRLNKIREGLLPEEEIARHNLDIAAFVDEYLKYSAANKTRRSYERDEYVLRKLFIPFVKTNFLSEITPRMIEQFKIERTKAVRNSTVNKELTIIKAALNKALEWDYIQASPARLVKIIRQTGQKLPRFLTREEISTLTDLLPDHLRQVFLFYLHTGIRRSELINLRPENVDLKRRILTIQRTDEFQPKGKEPRVIPLNEEAMRILAGVDFSRDYIFANQEGRRWIDTSLSRAFRQAFKRAGIKGANLHTLRHSFASHLVMSGVDIRTVKELLGHKDIKTTMIYSHLTPQHLKDAVSKLDGLFGHKSCKNGKEQV